MVAALLIVAGCGPEPLPSQRESLCEDSCAQLECLDLPEDAELKEQCSSRCEEKFEAAAEQSQACLEAFARAQECVVELACDPYLLWIGEDPQSACPTARQDVEQACDQLYLEPHISPP